MGIRGMCVRAAAVVSAACAVLSLGACSGGAGGNAGGDGSTLGRSDSATRLEILSGSENKELEPVISKAAEEAGVAVHMEYKGSLDIMNELESGAEKYDAVWPASSLWLQMGDSKHVVKRTASMSTTPVVLAVREDKAKELGWDDPSKQVSVNDLLSAVSSGKLKFAMTSATQSNSGASAYIGILYALAGKQTGLTSADLDDAGLKANVKKVLSGVNRGSGSSDWLKDSAVKDPDDYPAFFNYEALVIDADRQLKKDGKEPYRAVYLSDGLTIADSPLGYVDHGDQSKSDAFDKLQKYLKSDEGRAGIAATGRRTGLGSKFESAGTKDLDKSWGIQTDRTLAPITMPEADVLRKALEVYQSELRKPSLTAWVLDYSGSMSGNGGEYALKDGMSEVLDPTNAKRNLLQAGPDDISIIVPFSSDVLDDYRVQGNDSKTLSSGLERLTSRSAEGGTELYNGLLKAADDIKGINDLDKYTVAVVLMTDGQSGTSNKQEALDALSGMDVPVFSIMYGDADRPQLDEIADRTHGAVFDGSKDLVSAIRQAKGYN